MSMELRMLLAIVASFLIFMFYQVFFVEKTPAPVHEKDAVQEVEGVKKETHAKDEDVKVLDEQPPPEEAETITPTRQVRRITVSTPLYVAEFTEKVEPLRLLS